MHFTEHSDPIQLFSDWYAEVAATESISEKSAMALATATKDGSPSVRMVLLKGFDARGFVFYTNTQSRKGDELKANPKAALLFYWMPLDRQVRVEGTIEKVTDAESDAYFASRHPISRIGAIASDQSRPLDSRETLVNKVKELEKHYPDGKVPRPAHWFGYRVIPQTIEFWQQGDYRLHDRIVFTRNKDGWTKMRLYP